jgi:hypothetical protein
MPHTDRRSPSCLGRRQKALNDMLDFIDVCTLQDARISGQTLSIEILNKLCVTFPARLEWHLDKGGESIMHDVCRLGDKDVTEDFGQGDSQYRACSTDEDRIIFEQKFRVADRRSIIARFLEDWRASQVKNGWFWVLRHQKHIFEQDTGKYLDLHRHIRTGGPDLDRRDKGRLKLMPWPSAWQGCPNWLIKIKIFIGMYIDVARSWGLAVVYLLGISAHYQAELTNEDTFMRDQSCKGIGIKQRCSGYGDATKNDNRI